MAELTFRSPGVSTREIDLSQPSVAGPQGVPAGIIGTALDGPAFVPITVSNFSEFKSVFGATDGSKFGPLAANQWLKNARACTYIRILGVGDGNKRNVTTGVVTNAGYVVGNQQIQASGIKANNPFANHNASGAHKGRTYFLGAFMSESNGSTIFSDAGIQDANAKATASFTALAALEDDNATTLEITNPDGTVVVFSTNSSQTRTNGAKTSALACTIGTSGTDTTAKAAQALHVSFAVMIATGELQATLTPSTYTDETTITLTSNVPGATGNRSIVVPANIALNGATAGVDGTFTGGTGGAVPILRGVLLAASGVILHLSCSNEGAVSTAPGITDSASAAGSLSGQKGAITGSVRQGSQNFVMLMNGFKGTNVNKTIITASFDMTSPSYFAKVFNTDPFKTEEKGHLLYGSYDIHPKVAAVTGSGTFKTGQEHYKPDASDSSEAAAEDVGFIMTGSNERGATSNLNNCPDFEDFRDRFSTAETPYFISQNNYKLFKLVALSPGANISNNFKISIENIRPSTSKINKYGSFDLVLRTFSDIDVSKSVIESFRGLTLDPTSDRYIGRIIGDLHTYFDFDNNSESQKIITEGSHPVRSRYVRVVIDDDVTFQNVDAEELPIGFRGPRHLVTSGSNVLAGHVDTSLIDIASSTNMLKRIVEPPIPYRKNLSIGTGLNKKLENRLYWGTQFSQIVDGADPNKVAGFDNSFNTFVKHFPTHRIDTTAFSVGDNAGAADLSGGTVLDSDKFNNNKFSLLNIQVRTGSNKIADPEQWISASYVRNGNIPANADNKTRAFKVSDLATVANRKYAKFTTILQGGFDGANIFNKDKQEFTNAAAKREIDDSGQSGKSDSTIAAYRKAIDIMGSKTDVDIQLLAIPGIRHTSVTDFAISAVEDRFDAMYIMDIEERDQVNTIVTSSVQNVHVGNTIVDFKNRGLDSSFTAAYFPDVTIVDPTTNALVPAPPSVAVLGAFANNDRIGHPWFAPAGYTRGGLDGVETETVKLNRDNLDNLYDADINPITSFPSTGVIIFGQKTLLQDQSALDRINVRRLLIDVRRKVRNVANSLLFEPNRTETLEKFTSLVNPILQRVQTLSGVDRYKVVIDTSTTTAADVENNTIRGKIFLQPTRTVEFVALDFVVTNAGSDLL